MLYPSAPPRQVHPVVQEDQGRLIIMSHSDGVIFPSTSKTDAVLIICLSFGTPSRHLTRYLHRSIDHDEGAQRSRICVCMLSLCFPNGPYLVTHMPRVDKESSRRILLARSPVKKDTSSWWSIVISDVAAFSGN